MFGRRLLALAAAVAVIAACGDSGTEPTRTPIPRADSLLVASLAGTYGYTDTIALEWSQSGRRDRVMSVQAGTLTAVVRSPLSLELTRRGVDSTWFDTAAAVSFVGIDSFPGYIWLLGDTLVSLGAGASVPREAVADSGVHYTTTALAHPDCQIWRMLWAPEDAADLRCRVAVHWRRAPVAGAPQARARRRPAT